MTKWLNDFVSFDKGKLVRSIKQPVNISFKKNEDSDQDNKVVLDKSFIEEIANISKERDDLERDDLERENERLKAHIKEFNNWLDTRLNGSILNSVWAHGEYYPCIEEQIYRKVIEKAEAVFGEGNVN